MEANTKRWLGQFKSKEGADKVETKTLNGVKVTFVTTKGVFSSGMPGGPTTPMSDYALIGAIMEATEGSVFVKFVGPEKVVKGAHTSSSSSSPTRPRPGSKRTAHGFDEFLRHLVCLHPAFHQR